MLRCDCVFLLHLLVLVRCGTIVFSLQAFSAVLQKARRALKRQDQRVEPKELFEALQLPYNLDMNCDASGLLLSGLKDRIHPLVRGQTDNGEAGLIPDSIPLIVQRLAFSQNNLEGHNCCVGICVSVWESLMKQENLVCPFASLMTTSRSKTSLIVACGLVGQAKAHF